MYYNLKIKSMDIKDLIYTASHEISQKRNEYIHYSVEGLFLIFHRLRRIGGIYTTIWYRSLFLCTYILYLYINVVL